MAGVPIAGGRTRYAASDAAAAATSAAGPSRLPIPTNHSTPPIAQRTSGTVTISSGAKTNIAPSTRRPAMPEPVRSAK